MTPGEPDYPVPPTRAGRWFFIQCERHGWLYYLTLPYWMARCAWLRRRALPSPSGKRKARS